MVRTVSKKASQPSGLDRHALAVLRYIHADARPGALTDWHPAFLRLDTTLAACARRYVLFCRRYRPMAKPARPDRWGHRRLRTLSGTQADRQTEVFAPTPQASRQGRSDRRNGARHDGG
ncbi:MAG: hypothetical protein HOH66_13145 [Rhodospirillaceae bacterium]|nr:hypothetical protein [Rhodospirillaceae bacterium]